MVFFDIRSECVNRTQGFGLRFAPVGFFVISLEYLFQFLQHSGNFFHTQLYELQVFFHIHNGQFLILMLGLKGFFNDEVFAVG